MEFNASSMPFWDISQTPMTLSQIQDDDFLTLLQKQFPTDVQIPFDLSFPGYNNLAVVNPQSLSDYPPPASQPTPSSSDSGNSPGSTANDNEDRSLKRKASDERMDVEPASKTAHTASTTASSSNPTKKTNTRRKSGNPTQDELRLLKRKEQNRAAQRAFRERKEKHVKDLEDKVEELELKNQRTESENENLRDLLTRLQEENVQLKKKQQQGEQLHSPSQPFTFAISKDSPATVGNNINSPLQKDSPSGSSTISSVAPQTNFLTPFTGSEFDFASLIPFDPAVLNTLDDTYTSPSSDDAMNLDFGFGKPNRQMFNILASDPAYMSFAEPSPPDSTSVSTPMNAINPFDFSALDQWSRSRSRPDSGDNMQTFDELFGGSTNFLSSSSGIDFNELMKKSPSLIASSPVSHTHLNGSGTSNVEPSLTSPSTNSPETPHRKGSDGCPKTKEQLLETINKGGLSSFVVDSPGTSNTSTQCEKDPIPFLKKSANKDAPMVMCRGSSFPKTEQNDKNIEVLSAWRSITSNPQFKDIDINELCTEFTNKAKCDGTKVVLEPSGVSHIIDTLTAKVQQKAAVAAAGNK